MSKPVAFIMVEGGRTWFRTSAETEEAIRTGFIMETVPLYTASPKREPLSGDDRIELHRRLRQQGELTQDGCWDAIEVFEEFLCNKAHGIGGGESFHERLASDLEKLNAKNN